CTASACERSLSARCLTGHHFVSTVSTRPFWLRKHVDRQDGSGSTGAANMNAAKPCPCRHRGIATGLGVTSPVGSPTIERRGRGQWTRSVATDRREIHPGRWLLLVAARLSVGFVGRASTESGRRCDAVRSVRPGLSISQNLALERVPDKEAT